MNTWKIRARLVAFAVVAVVALAYLAFGYIGFANVLSPGFTVRADFADSGGIFVGAEVDDRGSKVGTVTSMHVTTNGVEVDMTLDHGTHVSSATTATVTDRSALGEQYVSLDPATANAPYLHAGSLIPRSATAIPQAPQTLLADLDSLSKSIPTRDLQTDLSELSAAFSGLGPDLQRLLTSTKDLTSAGLADLSNTIQLISSSQTVLDTQVASAADITQLTRELASLTTDVRSLDPATALLFSHGIDAAAQVTSLLDDTQAALPVLLNNLITVNDVAAQRLPALRKVLVVFPYDLQNGASQVRYCDAYNTTTGKPIASTCHYDPQTGLPIYSAYLTLQLPGLPGQPPANPCTQGYQGTKQYLPNGAPASGKGSKETSSTPANENATCTASPTDPSTPNVRGSQNAEQPGNSNLATTAAYYDPLTGQVSAPNGTSFAVTGTSGAPVPSGTSALTWLLDVGGTLRGS